MQTPLQQILVKIAGLAVLALMLTGTSGNAAISPDPTFDGNGLTITKVGAGRDEALAIAVQDDGKIVVAGRSGEPDNSQMTVVRYLPDGSVDRDFSFNGAALVGAGSGSDGVRALKIDDDGNILLAGYATENGTRVGTLVRLLSDGRLDYRFGDQGIALYGGGASDFSDIELAADGKIVVAGTAGNGADAAPLFVRFEQDGAIDTSFGADGAWTPTDLSGEIHSLAGQADDAIIGGGAALDEGKRQLLLIRLTTEGSPVDAFGDQGRLTMPAMDEDVTVHAVELLPDGSLVAVGEIADGDGTSAIMIGHYGADGSPDLSLSENGMQRYDIGERSSAYAVSVLADGKILVTGYRQDESGKDTVILAFELAPVVGSVGSLADRVDDPAAAADEIRELLLLSELQLEDGVLDGSLLADAEEKGLEADLTTTELQGSDEESQAIETLADGTVFTAGSSGSATDSGILVAKYLAEDGTDTGGTGELQHTTSSRFYRVQTLPVINITRVSADTGGIITELNFDSESCLESCEELCSDEDTGVDDSTSGDSSADDSSTTDSSTDDSSTDDSTTGDSTADDSSDSTAQDAATSSTSTSCAAQCSEECSVPTVVQRGVVYSVEIDPEYDPDGSGGSSDSSTDGSGSGDGTSDGTDSSSDGSSSDSTDDSSVFNPLASASLLNLDDYFVTRGQTDDDSGTGQFASDIEDINPQTIYYARAYALLSDGTVVYGNQFEFRTEDSCFIATAAFGSIDGAAVQVLRQFRDRYLNTWAGGRALVSLYYHLSPPLADVVAQSLVLRAAVIILLLPVALWAWVLLHLNTVVMAVALAALYNRYGASMRLNGKVL